MEKITRRELGKRGLTAVAALTLPSLAAAQEPEKPKPDPKIGEKVAKVEAQLAKPLSAEAKELLKTAIGSVENTSAARLKHKLPENSEPCFVYIATPVRGIR